jgi:CRP-like cAMP-binding protein
MGSNENGILRPGSLSPLESVAQRTRYRAEQTIYAVGDPTHYWYRVESGGARLVALAGDGRRQILAFLLPGDFFGFSARAQHHLAAESVTKDTVIARYPRREAERLVATSFTLAEHIREVAFECLSRMQDRLVDIGRPTAIERVAAFLLELADRPCASARSEVVLEMSRFDIADYLAVSMETVSRSLNELRRRGTIALAHPRHVRIVDRAGLQAVAGSLSAVQSEAG